MAEIKLNPLEKLAFIGLEHSLEYYNNVGTPLSYTPKLCYVDYYFGKKIAILSPFKEQALAQSYLKDRVKEIRKKQYIQPSIVKQEASRKKRIERNKILANENEDADIFIFKPFRDDLTKLEPDKKYLYSCKVMAHELWHLIEMEKIPEDINYLVREGAAYYAGKKVSGEDYSMTEEYFSLRDSNMKLFNMVYRQIAQNRVYDSVDNLENPFLAMLDPKIRKEIHNDLDKILKQLLGEEI
jgi:hypothetical protein